MKRIALVLAFFSVFTKAFSQSFSPMFKDVDPRTIQSHAKPMIRAQHYRLVEVDITALRRQLKDIDHHSNTSIKLPLDNGHWHTYHLMPNTTMHPQLAKQFPNIRSYDIDGIANQGEFGKIDLTPHGFHAMIMRPGKPTIFIDPYFKDNTRYYIVYNHDAFISPKKKQCHLSGLASTLYRHAHITEQELSHPSCALRKHRLALAATYEYTQFHGGTKEKALAAEVTTINRVNGIYESEAGITMEIIPNNTAIIYDKLPQPYTSGNVERMILQNQRNIDKQIGRDHYDIGHVFDANAKSSGLAELGCVCNPLTKAMGVTGQLKPIGDPFDVDYVAHEMGHQFGANHTQNNACNREFLHAVEPGSGSTIMGYAGICPPNIQPHSDAYFHGASLQEMAAFTSFHDTCAITTPLPDVPVITDSNESSMVIPANTPFALNTTATSAEEGALLTYSWEQMNHEISRQPPKPSALGGPNFRSFSPSSSSTRYFPNLDGLAHHHLFIWEVLPSVSRKMAFRVTVRPNSRYGSCAAYKDYTVKTHANAGPFVVTYPNDAGIHWVAGTKQTVTWNVAKTDRAPIDAKQVNILLSIDDGKTYPIVLDKNVANDGSHDIVVPDTLTDKARVMVIASNGTFFNISSNDFSIG